MASAIEDVMRQSFPDPAETGRHELGSSPIAAYLDYPSPAQSHDQLASKPTGYPSVAQISRLAGNGSSEKRASSFEEVSHLLSSHQKSKLSGRRATSQIASPVVDFDVAIAEKPKKALQGGHPEEGPKSYYVINPIVPGSAWYFTKGKSNSDTHEYEVERVSTHLVDIGQNRIGYLIETATRDDVTAVAGGRPAPWNPNGQNGWSTTSNSSIEKANHITEAEPGKRANRFERFDSEGDFETQHHDESAIIVERQDIPLVTEMIFRQINTTRLKRNSPRMIGGSAEKHQALPEENGELAKIIEETLMAFRRPILYDTTPETGEADISPQSKLPVQFEMEHENQRTKLRPPVVSDPANTLSIPQTSITAADVTHKVDRAREKWQQEASSTSTTLISSPNVTSITWTKHGGHAGESTLSPDSAGSSLDEDSERNSQTGRPSSCRTHKDEKLEASQASIGSTSVASTITSFPKLLSRHCTREWIKPLVSLEDKSTNPSHQGVDDGTNRISREPHTSFTETTEPMCLPGDSFQSRNNSSYFTDEAPKSRRTTLSQSPSNTKSFGSQIGSSAHRRRSTLTYDSKGSPSTDHFFPNILGKFFVGRNTEEPETPDSERAMGSDTLARLDSPAHVQVHVGAP
ncbi:uncharacterized protein Triagg1_5823 [Trichoderma aggressivum f. europaeum]|uniref:Uncharacterized protein n=1 Tax=Trichoderma aggressivum f. europaeum TaxID=173218 RepID=A0AAE1IE59_9HYPO|nr:hypothetical protein Triagg1_5823 [Trichoderma aggressivum f. europaeum]